MVMCGQSFRLLIRNLNDEVICNIGLIPLEIKMEYWEWKVKYNSDIYYGVC